MKRRPNAAKMLAALTFQALADLNPDVRRAKGLPPLPPVPAAELSPEMKKLADFFMPQQSEETKENGSTLDEAR